jgi:AcrR family transcriptional regulator
MSPRVDPEERRAEILAAALRCFTRTGYNGTSMDDIVAESGLSKGTLYWHFENKRALFMALFDQIMENLVAPFQAVMDPGRDAPATERLRRLASASAQVAEMSQDFLTLPLNFLIEIWQDEAFIKHYLSFIEEFANQIETLIKEGINTGEFRQVDVHNAVWGMMAMYDGIFLYLMLGMPGDAAKQMSVMTDLIIEGLAARGD